jgi:hypothetical protein
MDPPTTPILPNVAVNSSPTATNKDEHNKTYIIVSAIGKGKTLCTYMNHGNNRVHAGRRRQRGEVVHVLVSRAAADILEEHTDELLHHFAREVLQIFAEFQHQHLK